MSWLLDMLKFAVDLVHALISLVTAISPAWERWTSQAAIQAA